MLALLEGFSPQLHATGVVLGECRFNVRWSVPAGVQAVAAPLVEAGDEHVAAVERAHERGLGGPLRDE